MDVPFHAVSHHTCNDPDRSVRDITSPALAGSPPAAQRIDDIGHGRRFSFGRRIKKPAGVSRRVLKSLSTVLADAEIFRRFLAAVSHDLVAHLGALIEVAEPSLLD